MSVKTIISKEKEVWHKHFIPSLVAGVVVGVIAFLFEETPANVLLFASVGASAVILTHSSSHRLTQLRTVLLAYASIMAIAPSVYFLNIHLPVPLAANIAILVFVTGMVLFLLNAFHPPAISASFTFVLFDGRIINLMYLLVAVLLLFILIRFITYVFSQNLAPRKFLGEFKKIF